MGLFDTLFGSKAQAGQVTDVSDTDIQNLQNGAAQGGVMGASLGAMVNKLSANRSPAEMEQAAKGAQEGMARYDAQTAKDTEGGAAATMQRAQDAARRGAASQSDQAVAQATKAARTGGMMPGQAALAGAGQAANAYGTGMAQGVDQFNQNVNREAQLGESMSQRLAQAGQTKAQIAMANAANQTAASEANASKPGLFGQIMGGIAGIGSLFSDKNLKEDIKPSGSISDSLAKIKSYNYKYKGSAKPEAGVMAQDLEKTKAAPAVSETAHGKVVDTDRLSTINTAAIAEQGARIKQIEKLVKELGGIKHA